MNGKLSDRRFEALVNKVVLPAGFQAEWKPATPGWQQRTWVVFNAKRTIEVEMYGWVDIEFIPKRSKRKPRRRIELEGDTVYVSPITQQRYSFSHRGVDSAWNWYSTYWPGMWSCNNADGITTLTEAIEAQIERAQKAIEDDRTKVTLPIIGSRITPERKADMVARLKAHKTVDLTPRGMGVGYIVSTQPQRGLYWSRNLLRETAELEAFFGITPLYISTFDHD